ncbi:MAG: hypothetical protein WCL02_03630 [bacterium]
MENLTKLVREYIEHPSTENFKNIENNDLAINLVFAVVESKIQTPADFKKIFNLDFYGYQNIYRKSLGEKIKWFAVICMWDTTFTDKQSHDMWQVSLQQMREANCYGDDNKKYENHLKFLEEIDDWYEECGAIDDEEEFDLLERSWRGTPKEIKEIDAMEADSKSFDMWMELIFSTKKEKRAALYQKIKKLFLKNYVLK